MSNNVPPPPPGQGENPYGQTPGSTPPPAPNYNQPMAGGAAPPNYLVWAILSTLFCCLPLGVASIVFSSQVNSKWAAGDVAGAQAASEKAKKFAMWSAIIGAIVLVVVIILQVTVLANSGTMTSP